MFKSKDYTIFNIERYTGRFKRQNDKVWTKKHQPINIF